MEKLKENASISPAPVDLSGHEQIEIFGAREHNLKNIDTTIPRNKLVVITGISGSGKSSLAFDTIYAEGQRRYMESFSAYARAFIGDMERPDVDKINGLSPVISIEQKTTSRNPRSTVGTLTEIYDFLRLLYARAGIAYSYHTGKAMIRQSEDQIVEHIIQTFERKKLILLAPVVKGRKGHYRELFVQIRKMGFTKVRVDGVVMEMVPKMQVDRYKTHDIEIVIDRIIADDGDRFRITKSVQTALSHGNGVMMVRDEDGKVHHFSKYLMDPETGLSYDEPAPNNFSFNSPYGACPTCNGLGQVEEITRESVIADPNLSISRGGLAPLGEYRDIWIFKKLEAILKRYKKSLSTPIKDLPEEVVEVILYGDDVPVAVSSKKYPGTNWNTKFEGIIKFLEKQKSEGTEKTRKWIEDFMTVKTCPTCDGARLKKESLHFKIADTNISVLANMDIESLGEWFVGLEDRLTDKQNKIAPEILKEIRKRIGFLLDVGLDYLTLNRPLRTLSGGEAQRIRLATQIGTQLVGVLYIMDEPSIGLHQRDNEKLINALRDLRDIGNTIIVVEHDKDMMLASDHIIDIGPGAGRHGGTVVAAGTPEEFLEQNGVTAQYLKGTRNIDVPKERRKGNGNSIELKGAKGNNLKNVDLTLPLGQMICVTGVSGSGKSTLIHDTLFPILNHHFFRSKRAPLPYDSIDGLKNIDKVIEVDQSPIGRTPRSNPATYTGVFSDIRTLFTELPEAKIRGYRAGRFSFNVKGGRCETCEGAGMKLIEMDFLPNVHVPCETCKGKRYNRETLEVRFKGKSISDVLDMTVEQAVEFFEHQPKILRKIQTLNDVGLGYISLGQHATTLSGGEAQRVKLATELSKKDTGKTLYILDEPTTGLHFQDIQHLLDVLNRLVDKGNSVLIIEHNLDVIKVADHVIDLGPEGGEKGGTIVAEGTPEKVAKSKKSHTARFLKEELKA
ncbi:excinuclease ABC subunit UvrA [Roseivirga pacifica]|uniref:excinuclease ABC subunit UvrA n=1 Tax=Roseivirga pacifica TaxID=1267423 RepID=UPI0020943248|nr:excinuclease ABC subunit UvrA [Roseivirga pacifica]MCO6359318.1 excinuclease ABC subunit UvrA [Roseivirga pacifica]MCO6366688.1 excinuclease ABC subunit UvrA [Roseivirga pacifica]MCO6370780.1 excinuclease ABC subunit UvrA [Roseivirga pacifica]MCO6374344.1 excinuclease ABC subunit UvrA [Roseivirga pacifica]MCO6379603.1 excinuclease ABC subunit UvrA [Roseivirga pacifica]